MRPLHEAEPQPLLPLDLTAQSVLKFARLEVLRVGQLSVDIPHLLAGMLHPPTPEQHLLSGDILQELGGSLPKARETIANIPDTTLTFSPEAPFFTRMAQLAMEHASETARSDGRERVDDFDILAGITRVAKQDPTTHDKLKAIGINTTILPETIATEHRLLSQATHDTEQGVGLMKEILDIFESRNLNPKFRELVIRQLELLVRIGRGIISKQ